jgi:hypothetical protein
MHLFGAVLLAALIGALTVGYLGHVSRQVADHGTPGARRVARGGRQAAGQGRRAAQKTVAEIWAEVRAADWLERRHSARERRASRPGTAATAGRGVMATARGIGRAARATGRGSTRGLSAIRRRLPVTVAVEKPGQPPAPPAPAGAPAPGRPPSATPHATQPGRGSDPVSAVWHDPSTDSVRPDTSNGSGAATGAGADLFTAIQVVLTHAMAGGLRSKQRAVKTLSDSFDYIHQQLQAFARQMSEPGQHYGPEVWEPLTRMAALCKAASSAGGESGSALNSLAGMNVGELADSARKAPDQSELNSGR